MYVRIPITPGETYIMEYSVWCSRYEDMKPVVKQNGDYRWTLTVPDLKIYLEGIGEVVTDSEGKFAFSNVPAGEYTLYTVLDNGERYEFRAVTLKPNFKLEVKLKYDSEIYDDAMLIITAGWYGLSWRR